MPRPNPLHVTGANTIRSCGFSFTSCRWWVRKQKLHPRAEAQMRTLYKYARLANNWQRRNPLIRHTLISSKTDNGTPPKFFYRFLTRTFEPQPSRQNVLHRPWQADRMRFHRGFKEVALDPGLGISECVWHVKWESQTCTMAVQIISLRKHRFVYMWATTIKWHWPLNQQPLFENSRAETGTVVWRRPASPFLVVFSTNIILWRSICSEQQVIFWVGCQNTETAQHFFRVR